MIRSVRLVALIAAPLALAACATPTPGVDVTRFHRLDSAPTLAGSYRIVDTPGSGVSTPFVYAVSRELDRLGLARDGRGERYDVSVTTQTTPRSEVGYGGGPGVSVGVGGSTGRYYGSGVGLGFGLDLTRLFQRRPDADTALTLSVAIRRAGDNLPLWEGRAVTAVSSRADAARIDGDAGRLAQALFANFPGRSGVTVTVP